MENYIISNIKENYKYIDGLKKIAEDIEPMTIEEYDQEYKEICSNNSLSEFSKTFYLSILKYKFFVCKIFIPYWRVTSYIIRNRITDFLEDFFTLDYNIIPITFPELYELLIQIPQSECNNILQKMNLSMKTISGVVTAIKNKSKSDFILYMESETNNLYDVCKALKVYELHYSFYSYIENGEDITDNEDNFKLVMEEFGEFIKERQANKDEPFESTINKYGNLKEFYYKSIANGSFIDESECDKNDSVVEEFSELMEKFDLYKIMPAGEDSKRIGNMFKDFFTNLLKPLFIIEEIPFFLNETEIKDELLEKKIRPDYCLYFIKKVFTLYYTYINIMFVPEKLSNLEKFFINNVISDKEEVVVKDIIEFADRYKRIQYLYLHNDEIKHYSKINSLDFVIPNDFFYNKMYTTESKVDEWLFSIELRPTDDNNKKKVQALQTFINTIAEKGYIEDNFNTKATFLYRITGRKLPNTKAEIIRWKDEMKNYNCIWHLLKNFEHDFLNKQNENVKDGLYKKAQGFFGIIGDVGNYSDRAENIKRTIFRRYYEQFKEDMK